MSALPVHPAQRVDGSRASEAVSPLARPAIEAMERLDAQRDQLDREDAALRKEMASLSTSERDPEAGGIGWSRKESDAAMALRECRTALWSHAQRLYIEAGARHWRYYIDDMRARHRVFQDGMFVDINMEEAVEIKVKQYGSEIEETQAAANAALTDPGWLAAKAIESAYLADYREVRQKAHASRKTHAVADARALEIQRSLIVIINKQTAIKNQREEAAIQLDLARELERAGIPEAMPLDPADKNPELFVDAQGRPNIWVKGRKGTYEQPVAVKPHGGNVRFGNILVLANGDELGWTLSWNRPHRVWRDVLSGPVDYKLAVMPQKPGDTPIQDVTGGSTLYRELDTTG